VEFGLRHVDGDGIDDLRLRRPNIVEKKRSVMSMPISPKRPNAAKW
jgi:hypothetical protein